MVVLSEELSTAGGETSKLARPLTSLTGMWSPTGGSSLTRPSPLSASRMICSGLARPVTERPNGE